MPGSLTVICGPMFAGKSTALIQRIEAARATGAHTVVVKPTGDDRYALSRVVTHDGRSIDAVAIRNAGVLLGDITSRGFVPGPSLFLAIDEAHFFGDGLVAPVRHLLHSGATVLVAGVERDHRGNAFAPFPALLIEADEVVKLHARCSRCGGRAVHSQRMIADDSHIVVGGPEAYEARCRTCFEGASRTGG